MIIHQDSLMQLVYEPKSDVLSVRWPDLIDVPAAVIQNSFTNLIDSINHYHITRLLLDSKGTVSNTPEEEYRPIAMKLILGLASTPLQKIARLLSDDEIREARAKQYSQEVQAAMTFKFTHKEFSDRQSAIAWLISSDK